MIIQCRYTKESVEKAFDNVNCKKDYFYAFQHKRGVFYPFNCIAEVSNLFVADRNCYLGYNTEFGVWMGLRSAVILDMDYEMCLDIALPQASGSLGGISC